MKRHQSKIQQPTPAELTEGLLRLIQTKFYREDARAFAQDRRRLLEWVVMFPAVWLDGRGVTVPGERYREILTGILMEARLHGTEKITYRPAWLAAVVQKHFKHHGDEIYEAAKAIRNLVDNALVVAHNSPVHEADPVRDLALARRLVKAPKRAPAPKAARQKELF